MSYQHSNDMDSQAYQDPVAAFTQGTCQKRFQRGGAFLRSRSSGKSRGGQGQTLSGQATKEAAMTETAAPIPISTRQIGFGVAKFLNSVSYTARAETLSQNHKGTISQYYRVGLALVEAKLHKTKIRVDKPIDEIEDLPEYLKSQEFLNLTSTVTIAPEPIASIVNSIGIYKDTVDYMFTTVLTCQEIRGRKVPHPENLILSNLRSTVVALANEATPQAQRSHFRQHNPIPWTRWTQDDILLNPDEIIVDGYTVEMLEDDLSSLRAHLEYVNTKYPKFISKIDWEEFEIGREVYVSNNLAKLTLTEKATENETNLFYVQNVKVSGNHKVFKSRVPQKEAELVRGIRNLLGEVSDYPERMHYYTLRSPRYLRYKSTLDYKSVIQIYP